MAIALSSKISFLYGIVMILTFIYNMQPIGKIVEKPQLAETIIPKNGSEFLSNFTDPPIIVAWTSFFRHPLSRPLQPLRNCSYKCRLVNRTEFHMYNQEPSAFIMHGRNLNLSDLPEAQPKQLKILMLMESPNYAGNDLAQLPSDYFNATISYRKDSRYYHPYGHFEPITADTSPEEIISEQQVQRAVMLKSQGCLIFISHCETPSKRGEIIQLLETRLIRNVRLNKWHYNNLLGPAVIIKDVLVLVKQHGLNIETKFKQNLCSTSRESLNRICACQPYCRALGRFTNITIKGACGDVWKKKYRRKASFHSASSNQSDEELIESHRFYLAFENGICKDYVTEKYFSRISQIMVPVVLRRKILEDIGLPSDSFIAVDDFKSLKDLGDYLNSLSRDDNAYKRYFEWTKKFTKPIMWRSDSLCMICKDIYATTELNDKNIARFYSTEECSNIL